MFYHGWKDKIQTSIWPAKWKSADILKNTKTLVCLAVLYYMQVGNFLITPHINYRHAERALDIWHHCVCSKHYHV